MSSTELCFKTEHVSYIHFLFSGVPAHFYFIKYKSSLKPSILFHHFGEDLRASNRVPVCRDNSEYGLSQWEEALPCNSSSHWLRPYLELFLDTSSGSHCWGSGVTPCNSFEDQAPIIVLGWFVCIKAHVDMILSPGNKNSPSLLTEFYNDFPWLLELENMIWLGFVILLAAGRCSCNLKKMLFWNSYRGYISWAFSVKLPSGECHKIMKILLMICQLWFRYWLGAIRRHMN